MRSISLLILLLYQLIFCKNPSTSSYADEYKDKKETDLKILELNKKNENSDENEIQKRKISKILFTLKTKRKNKNLTKTRVLQPNYSEYLYVPEFTPRNLPRSANKRKFETLSHIDRYQKSHLRRKTNKSIEIKINENNPASSILTTSCNTEDCERESDYNFSDDSEKKEKSITNTENKSFPSTLFSGSEKQHISHIIANVPINDKNNLIPRLKDRDSVSLPFAVVEKNPASLVLISTENIDKNFLAAPINLALDPDALTTKRDDLKSVRNIMKKNRNSFTVRIENKAPTDNDYPQYSDPVVNEDMNDFIPDLTSKDLISNPGMPITEEYESKLISTFSRNDEDTSVLFYIKDETFIRKPAVTLKTKQWPRTFPTVIQNTNYALNPGDERIIRTRILAPEEKYTLDIFPSVTEDTKGASVFESENDNFFETSSAAAARKYKGDLKSPITDNNKDSYIFKSEKENVLGFAKAINHTENIQKRKTTKNNSLNLSDMLNGNEDLNYIIKLYLKKKTDVEKRLLFFKGQNMNTKVRNRTINFNFIISKNWPKMKYMATNFPHLKDNDIEASMLLLNLTNPPNSIFDLKASTDVPKTIIPETPNFNLSEILILIKREHNVQRKVLYKLFLYLPVLYCNVLLTIACWKLLRHIHCQITLKNQARQIQGRIWYPPSSPPLKIINHFSSVERRPYFDNES